MAEAHPSAVAIVEAPDCFVLEGRPDIPGALAHSGKVQLFGGGIEGAELPDETVRRELEEELGLPYADTRPTPVWNGEVDSQTKTGPARRHVSLFHVAIESAVDLTLRVSGELVRLPKTLEAVEAHKDRLTPFAFRALRKHLTGEAWEETNADA